MVIWSAVKSSLDDECGGVAARGSSQSWPELRKQKEKEKKKKRKEADADTVYRKKNLCQAIRPCLLGGSWRSRPEFGKGKFRG